MKYYYNLLYFFKNIATQNKDNISISYEKKEYTYEELDKKSNQFIGFFSNSHILQNDVIAIANTKSFEDYAMMIACLKSGVTYVNLDIENPKKRINDIVNLCNPKAIFSLVEMDIITELCEENKVNFILYKSIENSDTDSNSTISIDGETIAYIMFTSGSTGVPKGVAITHQNLIHFINWIQQRYEIRTTDRFANISPMYFDNSVFDFYGALFSGATLVPVDKELITKPIELVGYIDKMQCTIWFSVPSALMYLTTMRVLTSDNFKNIRIFTFGGEGYPKSELRKLHNLYSNRATFINVYGPTECTCICSSYTISEDDFEDLSELPSLGSINQNFSYVILDENGRETKLGELCLLGPNVGKGYYNDPKRTQESFKKFTNKNNYEKNMYKTGDLVEKRNNLLYFKGRVDNQIKHMGYRIELEEIELAIYNMKEVEECVVVYKRGKANYGKIVAYISTNFEISSNNVKEYLKDKLPSYMLPNSISILDRLPKNQNGKIDRKELKSR
ncbi:amino acid adenylation domain-containing protein [Sulfurimonas sp.]|uniref:amino acid adenylation domain-containing protein n=1 Tax=Sulfurimonas sp. TaxID=2022749 RepID=UPI0019DC318A|nr:amino acid adenylation domain-containing protein [Sulfurimonas sp.]MBE0515250.1 amino acid adenylation domain-containing protein [Sulfurimonas sp.]